MKLNNPVIDHLAKILEALLIENPANLVLLDAAHADQIHASGVEIGPRLVSGFPPDANILIFNLQDAKDLQTVLHRMKADFPTNAMVRLVFSQGKGWEVRESPLAEIEESQFEQTPVAVFLQAQSADKSFETFQQVVARLRAPDGCPWDREQTHLSLRPHLLEEAYETLEAIDRQNAADLKEELGDLLLQIVLNAQISQEAGEFSMGDVIEGINSKIIHRHPHVFKDVALDGVDGVLKNWEKLKEQEREDRGVVTEKGLLDGAPKTLPALSLAQEYQDRAARVGFDWPDIDPVLAKVHEELEEVKAANTEEERSSELGDLLFAVVNLIRWYKLDAESALRATNQKFARRFKHIEQEARKKDRKLSQMNLAEMDVLWEEAKLLE